jgi:hypothetical protein
MATCKVYGRKSDTGPSQLATAVAQKAVDDANPTWRVTSEWSRNVTTFESAAATDDELETAFKAQFSDYNVVGC